MTDQKPVTLTLSPAVMAYFKVGGAGWEGRIDAALLEAIAPKPAVQPKASAPGMQFGPSPTPPGSRLKKG